MARVRVSLLGEQSTLVIDDAAFLIGRRDDNDVVVDDGEVSRAHARIEQERGMWRLVDLGSTNGTTVNGTRLKPWEPRGLSDADVIVIGPALLEFVLEPGDHEKAGRPTFPRRPSREIDLTAAETEVLELLFVHYDEGDSMPVLATIPEIASRRYTSRDAVKQLLRNMYRKFEIDGAGNDNKQQLADRAQEWGVTRRRA